MLSQPTQHSFKLKLMKQHESIFLQKAQSAQRLKDDTWLLDDHQSQKGTSDRSIGYRQMREKRDQKRDFHYGSNNSRSMGNTSFWAVMLFLKDRNKTSKILMCPYDQQNSL